MCKKKILLTLFHYFYSYFLFCVVEQYDFPSKNVVLNQTLYGRPRQNRDVFMQIKKLLEKTVFEFLLRIFMCVVCGFSFGLTLLYYSSPFINDYFIIMIMMMTVLNRKEKSSSGVICCFACAILNCVMVWTVSVFSEIISVFKVSYRIMLNHNGRSRG